MVMNEAEEWFRYKITAKGKSIVLSVEGEGSGLKEYYQICNEMQRIVQTHEDKGIRIIFDIKKLRSISPLILHEFASLIGFWIETDNDILYNVDKVYVITPGKKHELVFARHALKRLQRLVLPTHMKVSVVG